MISVAPTITEAGRNLQIRAIAGETITFTRFKIGNGELADTDIPALVDLINPLVEFSINEMDKSEKGYLKLTGKFDSTFITSDFRWRELGVFCKGEDEVEVLYAYSNDGENAGMLKANSTDVVAEQTVALVIAVGDATSVTAILSESVLYAAKTDFDAHVADKTNPHAVTKEQVGLGNVPNVTTNNQTPTYTLPQVETEMQSGEAMGTAFGKIAKVVKSFIAHLSNKSNPHGCTPENVGAAKSEHTHSAADVNTGTLSPQRGGTGISSPTSGGLIKGNGTEPCGIVRGTGALYSSTAGNPRFGTLPVNMGGTGVTSLASLRNSLGIISIGEYTGDGSTYQFINLGYRPKFVRVICDMAQTSTYYNALAVDGMNDSNSSTYLYTDVSSSPSSYYHYVKLAIVDTGFYVYYCSSSSHPKTNYSGYKYHYIIGR